MSGSGAFLSIRGKQADICGWEGFLGVRGFLLVKGFALGGFLVEGLWGFTLGNLLSFF